MCGPSKLNHLWRTVPPSLAREDAARMDRAIEDAIFVLADVPPGERKGWRRKLIHLPIGVGGLGVAGAVNSLEAAYVGSWALVAHEIVHVAGNSIMEETHPGARHIREMLTSVATWFTVPGDGDPIATLCGEPIAGVQRSITKKKSEAEAQEAASWEGFTPTLQTQFNSQRGEKAGAWLTTLPVNQFTKIINTEFTVAMQLRLLFIPESDGSFTHCPLCKTRMLQGSHHAMTCSSPVCSSARTKRHHAVGTVMGHIIHSASFRPLWEKNVATYCPTKVGKTGLVADLVYLDESGATNLVEVTVVHPAMLPNKGENSIARPIGFMSGKAEAEKLHKYHTHHKLDGCTLHVVALETGGLFSTATVSFLKKLAARQTAPQQKVYQYTSAVAKIAVSLRKHVAQSVLRWRFAVQSGLAVGAPGEGVADDGGESVAGSLPPEDDE
jgi:hypothetical protein